MILKQKQNQYLQFKMKSNNKLQYLQKLASKNTKQQSHSASKASNLVGIGTTSTTAAGQPYMANPRFGVKTVKHQPKNTQSQQEIASPATSVNKKFTQSRKQVQKPLVIVGKDSLGAGVDIKDPRYDQFQPIEMQLSIHENDEDLQAFKNNNRKKQMRKRLQGLKAVNVSQVEKDERGRKKPILKNNKDEKPTEKGIRKQVSISEQPKIQSPGAAAHSQNKSKLPKPRGTSKDSMGNLNSDLAVSSAGINPDDESNSIISEEDSAFEDQTPAAKMKKNQVEPSFSNNQGVDIINKEPQSRMINNPSMNLQNDEEVVGNMKSYIRQKTLGWKQTNHDTTRWPFKRSPTHKSRNADQESSGSRSKNKFKLKVMPSSHQKQQKKKQGFGGQSRHSSLNYTSDHQMDQLSINFGKNIIFSKEKGSPNKFNGSNLGESQSVASVISKGGTVMNPFAKKRNSGNKFLARSTHKSKDPLQNSARRSQDSQNMRAGEQNLDSKDRASKTHVRFPDDIDQDIDVRKSYHRNNQKMINIYLKTPYKVLTIDEIKTKEKQDKEREFLDASSPNRLFIAENNLKIHTMYREKNKYASTSKGRKFQKTLNYFSGDEECNLQNYNTKTRMIKDSSISQMSESKSTKNQYVHDQESVGNAKGSVGDRSEINLVQLTSSQLKHLKDQKLQLETEFKKKFYDQLQQQLEKRIEQVKMQTNILTKQKNLYQIYGTNNISREEQNFAFSPDQNRVTNKGLQQKNVPIGLNESSIESVQTEIFDNPTNGKRFIMMQEQHRPVKEQAKALHNSAIQPTESKLSKSPSKMDHGSVNNSVLLKNSNDEIPRNMLYDQSKYSRISDNDITRDENTKVDVEQIEDDEREHRVTSYSYDFEQKDGDASLKKLLSMSNTLGYSHKQQKMLRQKQMELEQAEKKLQRQQRLQGKPTVHDGGSANNTSGVFLVPEKTKLAKKSKYHDQQGSRNFSQTEKKPSKEFKRMPKLQAISEQKRRRPPPPAGVENEENVKDYFDNKISLRRSIEKKLHYDSKQTQKQAAGHNYPTSAQKHQQLLADLKQMKKERARQYNTKFESNHKSHQSYTDLPAEVSVKGHQRNKTNATLKRPEDQYDTTLPEIKAPSTVNASGNKEHLLLGESLRKQKSNVKDKQSNYSLDERIYPLKKSGTQNEKNESRGLSPIRLQRNNVIMAYNVHAIQTSNPQFLASQENQALPYGITKDSMLKSASKKQLGFQFKNSPRPSIHSNGLQPKDSSFTFEDGKFLAQSKSGLQPNQNTSPTKSKFILNKQSQLMKGVLSNGNRKVRPVQNGKFQTSQEATPGTLPQINQSSSYTHVIQHAPGQ